MRKLVANRIETPDGTILQSYFRHDYKTYEDVNGVIYCVDGGTSYLRRNGCAAPYVELSLYHDDSFELVREAFSWGGRGINGDQPVEYKPLKELDTAYIEAILRTQTQICAEFRELFEKELEWRDSL